MSTISYNKIVTLYSDSTLLSLSRRLRLPDTEFWMNLGDWPHQKVKSHDKLAMIISWKSLENTQHKKKLKN